jgi:hypothetical protein
MMMKMNTTTAYAPVSVLDEPLEDHGVDYDGATAAAAAATVRLHDHGHPVELRCPPPTFQHLPEARNLTWTDPFYDGKYGVVAAFDRDAERAGTALASRYLRHAMVFVGVSILYWILGALDYKYSPEESVMDDILGVYTLAFACLFGVIAWRARQAMMTQHVAVTTEGIRIDNGTMLSLTIPFEHIQKIDVQPHKACCIAPVDPMLLIVTVHRESTPLERLCCQQTKKLELYGILRGQEFSDLVLGLKESQIQGSYQGVTDDTLELASSRVELPIMSGQPRMIATMESV